MGILKSCFTHCAAIWSRGWRINVWSIIEHKIVLDTVSRIINADEVEADGNKSSSRSDDGPFAVSVVWVSARIPRAGEGAVVSIKSSTTACKKELQEIGFNKEENSWTPLVHLKGNNMGLLFP